jgi:DNA-binding HxlR family transcriptional regulator
LGRRSYRQTCHAARALDRVGERWTLLVVRELLTGPRRFGELLDALPGIGPNLLSQRLRRLEADGLVERIGDGGRAAAGWALTERGRELEPVLLALVRFGSSLPERRRRNDHSRAGWDVLAARALFRPEAAGDLRCLYELRVGDEVFCFDVRDGALTTWSGPPDPGRAADVVIETDPETWQRFTHAEEGLAEAERRGRATIHGDRRALRRLPRLFAAP